MIVLLMGVAGIGKTTVGTLLADQLGWKFADADSYHSPENIQKMRAGIPLTDTDRGPWLRVLREAIQSWVSKSENVVLACSALKETYREKLLVGPEVKLVYLHGSFRLVEGRMHDRVGHYMPLELLRSQFGTLEEPEDATQIDASATPSEIVREIRRELRI